MMTAPTMQNSSPMHPPLAGSCALATVIVSGGAREDGPPSGSVADRGGTTGTRPFQMAKTKADREPWKKRDDRNQSWRSLRRSFAAITQEMHHSRSNITMDFGRQAVEKQLWGTLADGALRQFLKSQVP
jgi:hypothetical protein